MSTGIAVFKGKEIRKTLYNNEWWFSVVDVMEVLTGNDRPRLVMSECWRLKIRNLPPKEQGHFIS
jgi:prophage antirepressor-like protein